MFSQFTQDARLANNKISFTMNSVGLGISNALRRVILSEIPNVAVGFDPYHPEKNDITFITNTSSLHNEFLGHRLSLIPIHLTRKDIEAFKPENFKFVIDEHNTSTEPFLITTKHIKVYGSDGNLLDNNTTRSIFPPDVITNDFIIITKLKPNLYDPNQGEKIHVEFTARKGIAKENAAWCPVSLCSYTFTIDEEEAREALNQQLANVADAKEKDKVIKLFQTLNKQRYYKKNQYGEPESLRFSIESECALSASNIFEMGIEVLQSKLNSILPSDDPNLQSDKLDVYPINEAQNLYAIVINGEDHTIGNLLQSLIYEDWVRPKNGVTFVGYHVPHPLEARVVIKIRFDKVTDIPAFIQQVVENANRQLATIKDEWTNFMQLSTSQQSAPKAPPRRIAVSRKKAQS